MALIRIHAVISGRVQGVYFRASTVDEARKLGLCGWVRNRNDGKVETEIQGEETEVRRLLNWLHKGPPMSTVSGVISHSIAPVEGERKFVMHY
ncbi:MAG TPA: acylphosphatase [Desulfobacterales bacterium]|nr:acylphosphatase [Desulfobacterales bacterium]